MADYQLTHPGPTVQQALDIALGVEQQISQEAAAREAADALLATKTELAAETSRAQAAEALLATIAMLDAEIARATGVEGTLQSLIAAINEKIPSAASSANQLADKAFVNSSIGTSSATYISNNGEPFTSVAQLNAYTGPHDKNDYAFVVSTDAAGNTVYSRYKYDGSAWAKEYDLNNSSFTAAQWAAINSAVTAELVTKLSALPDNATLTTALAAKQDVIDDLSSIRSKANSAYQKPAGGIPKTDLASGVQTSLDKADSAIQDVSDKADKDTDAVEGNVAQFDANGNPVDGGVPVENIAQKDGYYGGMTVGAAENLVGRGVVEAEYVDRRTSAGSADIGSGSASIRKIMGRSVKWNQLVQNGNFADGTTRWAIVASTSSVNSGILSVTTPGNGGLLCSQSISNNGHKYYGSAFVKATTNQVLFRIGNQTTYHSGSGSFERLVAMYNGAGAVANTNPQFLDLRESGYDAVEIKNVILIDLTLIFGAGNEPATVTEFEEWLAQNVGTRDYYPYTEPTILNNAADGIKTRGFNLYNPATGKAYLPGKYSDYPHEYEICGTFSSISYTDINGNTYVPELTDGRFFNVSAPGELTVVGGNSTDTLVHLVWSGWRNEGEPDYAYEPYWENTLPLNMTTLTGKLNGEGESVVIAPNGLAKVGDVMDYGIVENGYLTQIVKRIGVVDMGTLTWRKNVSDVMYSTVNDLMSKTSGDAVILSSKYASQSSASTTVTGLPNTPSTLRQVGNTIAVYDSAYTDAATFKTAMSGVLLYFELATPQVYVLDEPIAMNYRVDDFGTEETIPAYDPQRLIAPLAYDVQYAMNAVDVIRRLPDNYVERADVKQTPGTSEKHILSQKGVEDNYAHKVGTEDNLTVGLAKNIEGNATSGGYPFTFVRISGTDGLAKINNVKGKSVVWNQLQYPRGAGTTTNGDLTFTSNSDGSVVVNGTAGSSNVDYSLPAVNYINGHKYLRRGCPSGGVVDGSNKYMLGSTRTTVMAPDRGEGGVIFTAGETVSNSCIIRIYAGVSVENIKFWPQNIDLTLMFGAGNEPATVEEFEALYPLPYYDYNAGEIISNKTEQVVARGFNQWDEEWESGGYDANTGEKITNNYAIRSKNFIRVFPNVDYYLTSPTASWVFFYDADKRFLYRSGNSQGHIIETPSDCRYITFICGYSSSPVTSYNHDICINLSDASRNGTYEPYKTNTIELNLPTLTGKLNGEGESVTVFPDGLKSAGSVYDEIVGNKAIKRVGVVDMGTRTFTKNAVSNVPNCFYADLQGSPKQATFGAICSKYPTVVGANTDKTIRPYGSESYNFSRVSIKDSAYDESDTATFKAAMSGVLLYYELATPEEYILDTPIPEAFQSYKGGTLEQIPQNAATPVTAPCAFSVTYAIDAAGIITGLPQNYVSKESMQAFLTALGAAMSGTWTMTWDDTTGRYTFTFTPNE